MTDKRLSPVSSSDDTLSYLNELQQQLATIEKELEGDLDKEMELVLFRVRFHIRSTIMEITIKRDAILKMVNDFNDFLDGNDYTHTKE